MKVLVTGATSLLGKGLVTALRNDNHDVTTLQRTAAEKLTGGVTEVLGDITNAAVVERAVERSDVVVHLAAKVDVTGPWRDFLETNVDGTANVLQASIDAGINRFVYVSSPSVAHAGTALIGADAAPADPSGAKGPYAKSKAMAERLALEAAEQMPVVVIRPHLVWGPGDTQLVGRLVDRARARRLAVIGSGAALVDSTYIDNAVDALVAAIDRCPDLSGQVFVVSNGEPRPISELVRGILGAHGLALPARHVPVRLASGVGSLVERIWDRFELAEPPITSFVAEQMSTAHWFDQRRTRESLRWTPAISIDQGLKLLAQAVVTE